MKLEYKDYIILFKSGNFYISFDEDAVILNELFNFKINELKNNCQNLIKPDEGFGAVKYIRAKLNDTVDGAIVFPAKTTHEENYLEFISKNKLRDELVLNDGDIVSLEFQN